MRTTNVITTSNSTHHFLYHFQLVIETSRDSDQSLVQLVFYSVLEEYDRSLSLIQLLKGVPLENIAPSDISHLPESNSFSIKTSLENRDSRETIEKYIERDFRTNLDTAYNMLVHSNAEWQQTRFFTDDMFNDLAGEVGIFTPIPNDLMENIQRAEFSLDFTNLVTSKISGYSETLYCTSCETHNLESYNERGLHKTLMLILLDAKFENIWNNILAKKDELGRIISRPGVNQRIADTITNTYFASIHDPLRLDEPPPAKYLELLESLRGLVDQWIEKALELMMLSREQRALQTHQDYVQDIIQEANRISLVNDDRLSIYALYQAVISQKNFPIHPDASQELKSAISSIIFLW